MILEFEIGETVFHSVKLRHATVVAKVDKGTGWKYRFLYQYEWEETTLFGGKKKKQEWGTSYAYGKIVAP